MQLDPKREHAVVCFANELQQFVILDKSDLDHASFQAAKVVEAVKQLAIDSLGLLAREIHGVRPKGRECPSRHILRTKKKGSRLRSRDNLEHGLPTDAKIASNIGFAFSLDPPKD
jgi:hypothetical protein